MYKFAKFAKLPRYFDSIIFSGNFGLIFNLEYWPYIEYGNGQFVSAKPVKPFFRI